MPTEFVPVAHPQRACQLPVRRVRASRPSAAACSPGLTLLLPAPTNPARRPSVCTPRQARCACPSTPTRPGSLTQVRGHSKFCKPELCPDGQERLLQRQCRIQRLGPQQKHFPQRLRTYPLPRSVPRLHRCRHGVHRGRPAQPAEQRQRGGSTGRLAGGLGTPGAVLFPPAGCSALQKCAGSPNQPAANHQQPCALNHPTLTGRGAVASDRHGGGGGHLPRLLPGRAATGKAQTAVLVGSALLPCELGVTGVLVVEGWAEPQLANLAEPWLPGLLSVQEVKSGLADKARAAAAQPTLAW